MKFRIGNKYRIFVSIVGTTFILMACTAKPAAVSTATVWEGGQTRDSLAVEGLTVTRGTLVNTVTASGVVSGVNEAVVVSETQGLIRKLSFSIGDRVNEGQELLKVDDSIASLNLQRSKDQLDSANLELKGTELQVDSGGSSLAALTRARSAVSAAKAQYETSLKAFKDTTVKSPIAGIVASREESATIGNIIGALTRIARIVDNSSFKITVGVGEREIGLIEAGSPVRISIPSALGDRPVEGTVAAVGAGADSATGSFPVVVSFKNQWGNLVKSGMSATIEIDARETEPAIIIPVSALVRRENKYAVFTVKEGASVVREVQVGRRVGIRTEILSGISEGDIILISALSRLQNGNPVTVTVRGDSSVRE